MVQDWARAIRSKRSPAVSWAQTCKVAPLVLQATCVFEAMFLAFRAQWPIPIRWSTPRALDLGNVLFRGGLEWFGILS